MKNFTRILVAGALAAPLFGTAQVNVGTSPTGRNAIVEEWTGIHCGYCPIGHATVNSQMTANPGRVFGINVHSGSFATPGAGEPDFRTTYGNGLDNAFPITGYPASTLNRRTITYTGSSGQTTGQVYHPAYLGDAAFIPTVLAETAEVNIWGEATIDINTRVMTVNLEYYYTSSASNSTNYLNVAVIQDHIAGPQSDYGNYNPSGWIDQGAGIYDHRHVFRDFLTGQWGAAINSTTAGSTGTMSYTYTLPADYTGVPVDLSNIELVVYINNGYQSAGNVLNGIGVEPALTGFSSANEVIYTSASTPDIQVCDPGTSETISPQITIQNWGSAVMTSAQISYNINGGTAQNMTWNGSINPGGSQTITLNPITFVVTGSDVLNVTVSNPNGVADNAADNSGTEPINTIVAGQTDAYVTVHLQTDNYANEIWMEIRDGFGTLIWSEGNENVQGNYGTGSFPPATDPTNPLTNTTTYDWQVPLGGADCYTFAIYDYYGDGLAGSTPGTYNVKNDNGNVIITASAANYGGSEENLFKNNTAGLDELAISNVSVYPNPATEVLNVSFQTEGTAVVSLSDLQGRVLATQNGSEVAFSVANLAAGSYIVTIASEGSVYTENVIIK